jgi:hypothetical protein
MIGRGWIFAAGAAVVAAGAGVAGVTALGGDDQPPADEDAGDPAVEQTTVEVVRRDLARVEELDGSVGHGDSTPLVVSGEGTLTGLPEPGDVLESGDVVAEVDGWPIIALPGTFPLWRTLGPGVEDGKDVLQVEYMLASLGYAQEYDVTVDDDWTSATTDAVEAFQEDHGQDDDGEIDLGELLFLDGPVQVAEVTGVPGQPVSEAGISVTRRSSPCTSTSTLPTPTCSPSVTRSTSSCPRAGRSPGRSRRWARCRPTRLRVNPPSR